MFFAGRPGRAIRRMNPGALLAPLAMVLASRALAEAPASSETRPASVSTFAGDPGPAARDSLLAWSAPDSARVTGTLSLGDALTLALRHHPGLAAASWRVRAAGSRIRDEVRGPAPVLDVTEENFGGDLGFDRNETTVSLSQTLEMGGKRRAREAVARGLEAVAIADLTAGQREVVARAGDAFLQAWWLERRVAMLEQAVQMARDAVEATAERVRQGAGNPVERLRAESEVARREVELRLARAERESARRALALEWGATEARFDSLALPPLDLAPLPPADALRARLDRNPDLRRAQVQTALASALLIEARAARRPDLTVSGGVRRFQEIRGTGFLTGVSIPLVFGGRGRGFVLAAEAELEADRAEQHVATQKLENQLLDSYDQLAAARDVYALSRDRELPALRNALEHVDQAFRAGRFTYLDHADAQRQLIDAELTMIQAAHDAWSARVKLETLIGASLNDLSKKDGER